MDLGNTRTRATQGGVVSLWGVWPLQWQSMALKPKLVLGSHLLRMQGRHQLQMVRDPSLGKKEVQERGHRSSQGILISRVKTHIGQQKDLKEITLRRAGTRKVRPGTNLRMTQPRMNSRMKRQLTFQLLVALKKKCRRLLRSKAVLAPDQLKNKNCLRIRRSPKKCRCF